MNFTLKKIVVVLVLAVVLSLASSTSVTFSNTAPCAGAISCDSTDLPRGELTTIERGFPRPHKTEQIFKPDAKSRSQGAYAEARSGAEGINYFSVGVNVVFWFALLYLLAQFIRPRAKLSESDTQDAAPETAKPKKK